MPPRRTTQTPHTPILSPEQMRRRIEGLRRCIEELNAFDPVRVEKRYNIVEVVTLETSINGALEAAFGHGTPRFNLYKAAANLDQGPHIARMSPVFGRGPTPNYEAQDAQEARQYLSEGKERSIKLLQQAIRTLEDEIADHEPIREGIASATRPIPRTAERKVFVVHGHDEGAREAVARFLEKIGFEAIILHEKANEGRTVIEKVEAHGDVGFAVVLLTPDDEGCAKGETLKPRARQNVVLELGYFVGRLSRKRVFALKRGEIEIPSDFGGVVYEPFDGSGGWKQALAENSRRQATRSTGTP